MEVCINNAWGTICGDSFFSPIDAGVLCGQLGGYFTNNSEIIDGELGSGPIFLERLECNQEDTNILDCSRFSPLGLVNCDHSLDVSIRCTGRSHQTLTFTQWNNLVLCVQTLMNVVVVNTSVLRFVTTLSVVIFVAVKMDTGCRMMQQLVKVIRTGIKQYTLILLIMLLQILMSALKAMRLALTTPLVSIPMDHLIVCANQDFSFKT